MLVGNKVILSCIKKQHLKQIIQWRNNTRLRQYFREYQEISIENQHNWFEQMNKSTNEYFFSIYNKKDMNFIGICGLNYIHRINRNAQLSLYIGDNEEYIDDKGFALDSAKLIINYGFNDLNLEKIICEIFSFDDKKKQLIEKLNFKLEGKLKKQVYKNGIYFDLLIFGLLRRNDDKK